MKPKSGKCYKSKWRNVTSKMMCKKQHFDPIFASIQVITFFPFFFYGKPNKKRKPNTETLATHFHFSQNGLYQTLPPSSVSSFQSPFNPCYTQFMSHKKLGLFTILCGILSWCGYLYLYQTLTAHWDITGSQEHFIG